MTNTDYDVNKNLKTIYSDDKTFDDSVLDDKLPIPNFSFYTSIVVIIVLSIIPYWNVQYADFTFDDNSAILDNKDILPTTPLSNLFFNDFWGTKITSKTSHKSYRPLTVLTFRWSYYIVNRYDAWSFHFVNIILHSLNSVLLFYTFSVLFTKTDGTVKLPKAILLCGILFAVHPIHTESVAATVGRADLLCTFFYLMSFLCYVYATQNHNIGVFYLVMSIMFSFLGLFCKEQGITVLGVCIIYDIVFVSKLGIESMKNNGFHQMNRNSIKRIVVVVICGILFVVLRLNIMGGKPPTFQEQDNPASFHPNIFYRVVNYLYIYSINFWLLLSPWWLCFDWAMGCIPLIQSIGDYRIVFPLLVVIISTLFVMKILMVSEFHLGRLLILSIAFLIIPFLPAMNIFFRVGFVIAERNLYIPSIGYIMIVVFGFIILSNSMNSKVLMQLFMYGLIILYIARCMHRCQDWMKEEILFHKGLDVCPNNAKVHYNVGKMHQDGNRPHQAIESYLQAIRLYPHYDQPMNNIGNLYKEKGMFLQAEFHLEKAVNITPTFAAAWMNLGGVKAELKKKQDSIHCYENAIKHRNYYPDAYYNWGNLHLDYEEWDEAYQKFKMAISLKQDHIQAWQNLIMMLGRTKRKEELKVMTEKLLHVFPNNANLISIAGNSFAGIDDFKTAEKLFKMSIKLLPNSPATNGNLAVIYHRWKRYDEALKYYEMSLKLDPTSKMMRENLAKLKRILARQ